MALCTVLGLRYLDSFVSVGSSEISGAVCGSFRTRRCIIWHKSLCFAILKIVSCSSSSSFTGDTHARRHQHRHQHRPSTAQSHQLHPLSSRMSRQDRMVDSAPTSEKSDPPISILIITSKPGAESRVELHGLSGTTTVDELKALSALKAGYGKLSVQKITLITSGRMLVDGSLCLKDVFRDFTTSSSSARAVHLIIKPDLAGSPSTAVHGSAAVGKPCLVPSQHRSALGLGSGHRLALPVHAKMMEFIQDQRLQFEQELQDTLKSLDAPGSLMDSAAQRQELIRLQQQLQHLQERVERLRKQNQAHAEHLTASLSSGHSKPTQANSEQSEHRERPSTLDQIPTSSVRGPLPHLILNSAGQPVAMAIPPGGLPAHHHHTFQASHPASTSPPAADVPVSASDGMRVQPRARIRVPRAPTFLAARPLARPLLIRARRPEAAAPPAHLARLGSVIWILVRLSFILFLFGGRISLTKSVVLGFGTAIMAYYGSDRNAQAVVRSLRAQVIHYLTRQADLLGDLAQGVDIATNANEPNPRATADRLLRERREQANIMGRAIRATKRAILTFVATLDPQVAAGQAAAVRRASEAEEERRRRQGALQDTSANQPSGVAETATESPHAEPSSEIVPDLQTRAFEVEVQTVEMQREASSRSSTATGVESAALTGVRSRNRVGIEEEPIEV